MRQRRARPQASSLTLVSARHNDPPMSATSEKSDVEGSAVYPTGSRVNARGHLEVGGCDVVEVVAEFGTPVYIYAEDDIRARARAYLDAFRSRTEDLLASGVSRFVIDLTEVPFLDSAGMAVLVSLLKGARQLGGDAKLVWPRLEAAQRVLRLTKFDQVFELFDEVDAAVKAF